MSEPTKFTVSRADAATGEVGATYTYGTAEAAQGRYDRLREEGARGAARRIKITAWGAGDPRVVAEEVLTPRAIPEAFTAYRCAGELVQMTYREPEGFKITGDGTLQHPLTAVLAPGAARVCLPIGGHYAYFTHADEAQGFARLYSAAGCTVEVNDESGLIGQWRDGKPTPEFAHLA